MIFPVYEDIGKSVVYTGASGHEEGVITSFNDRYIFVRYVGQHPNAPGKATKREDLKWSHG